MKRNEATTITSLEGPILITGHTGFKGTWLTRYLLQLGVDVVGYSLLPKDGDLYSRANLVGSIKEEFADIREISKLDEFVKATRPSAILHLAAQPLVIDSYKDPLGTFATNVMGTANILEVARTNPSVKAALVVTTDKVYQNLNSGKRFRETDPLLGNDPYSASKVGTENVAAAWQRIIPTGESPTISVVRSGNVIGGGDFSKDRLLADLIRARMQKTKLEVRNPLSTRPWQHVLDPLHGYLLVLAKSLRNKQELTFNFGPTEPALSVEKLLQIASEYWPNIEIQINQFESTRYESRLLDLDSTKAREELSWTPKYSQKEAILSTLQWWDKVIENESDPLEALDGEISEFLKRD